MNCAQVSRRLTAYLERSCRKEDVAPICRHIEGCADCARELSHLQRTRALIRDAGGVANDPIAVSEILTVVRERTIGHTADRNTSRKRVGRSRAYLAAAVAALIAVTAAISWSVNESARQPTISYRPQANDDLSIYLREHELQADKSVFSNGAFESVSVSSTERK